MLKKTPSHSRSERNWTRTNLLHMGGGLLAAKVATVSLLGPIGVVFVGANYVSVSTRGRNLLPNPFAKNKHTLCELLAGQIVDQIPHNIKNINSRKFDTSLLKLIHSMETSKQRLLRHRAARYTLVTTMLSYVTPISMALIFTSIIAGGLPALTALGVTNVFAQLGILLAFLTGSSALESSVRHQATKAWKGYAIELEDNIRQKSYAHIQYLDMPTLEQYSLNKMSHLTYHNPLRIRTFLETVPNQILEQIASFIIGSTIMVLIAPISLLLALFILPVPYFLIRYFHDRLNTSYQLLGESEQNVSTQVLNSLSGINVIKSFNTEAFEIQRLNRSGQELSKTFIETQTVASKQLEIGIFSYQLGIMTPLIASGVLLLKGKIAITPFMIQSMLMGKLLSLAGGLKRDSDLYRHANAAANDLQSLLAKKPSIINGQHTLKLQRDSSITFENVSFAYYDEQYIIKNISLCITAGQHIAFVGPTGSGKSTIVKLLMRFYDVQQGKILIGDNDLRDLDLPSLRQSVGLVSQEVYLFPGTIYENICYGTSNATYSEVVNAARMAEAWEFIEKLPDGLATPVSEHGKNLSGGQRQRLSIARAILKNAPVLILDEATSAIDNETEALIQRSINRFSQGRTTIMIAHRLSTIRQADCIYVMKEGGIFEFGPHEELLQRNGYYAHLWRLQTGEINSLSTSFELPT